MKLFAHILILALVTYCQGQTILNYISENESGPKQCSKKTGTYFDSSMLGCEKCPVNTEPTSDYLGCQCQSGYIRIPSVAQKAERSTAAWKTAQGALSQDEKEPSDYYLANFLPACQACDGSQKLAPSQDRTVCLDCSGADVFYNSGLKQCQIDNDKSATPTKKGRLIQDIIKGQDIKNAGKFRYEACADGAFRGPIQFPIYECQRCEGEGMRYKEQTTKPWDCECSRQIGYTQAGDICLLEIGVADQLEKWPTDPNLQYRSVITGEFPNKKPNSIANVNSDIFRQLFLKSGIGCKVDKDIQSCQALANLCVLKMYSNQVGSEGSQCGLLHEVTRDAQSYSGRSAGFKANEFYKDWGYQIGVPWLFYQTQQNNKKSTKQVLEPENESYRPLVKFYASFKQQNLKYGIMKKLSFKLASYDIEGNFLGFSELKDQLFLCNVKPEDLVKLTSIGTVLEQRCSFDLLKLTNPNLYPKNANIFYEMYLVDYNGDLIDVPIKIMNYLSNGENPNKKKILENWVLTRRFFIYDTISGIQDGESKVVRYAQKISLKIQLDRVNPEKLYPPFLEIEYQEKRTEDIIGKPGSSNPDGQRFVKVQFTSESYMDTTGFWAFSTNVFFILIAVMCAVICMFALIQCKNDHLQTDQRAQNQLAAFKGIISSLELFSTFFFWYLFGMSAYWFVFYKLQDRVFCMLPPLDSFEENYVQYEGLLIALTVCKFLSMLYKITFEQAALDIFMIDWESPKMFAYGVHRPKQSVNPWRRLLIVNEFNELQGDKHMSSEMILILFLVISEGFGYKYWSLMETELSTTNSDSPESYPLNFFVTACIIFGIGCIQYFLTLLVSLKFPPAYVEFVDLCSVANISVIIFNEDLNGWYIHGKSPCGAADVSSERLRLNLEAETQGNATIRGIHSSMPNAQTFEIFLPTNMIDDYKKHFLTPVIQKIDNQVKNNEVNYSDIQRAITAHAALPAGISMSELDHTKELMNKIMKKYIEQVRAEPTRYIKEKGPVHRLFNIQPIEKRFPVMFKDTWMPTFAKSFLYGLDFDFMMLEVLVIACMDLAHIAIPDLEAQPNSVAKPINGIAFGVLIAYLIDYVLINIRLYKGRKNLATHTLSDERFLVS